MNSRWKKITRKLFRRRTARTSEASPSATRNIDDRDTGDRNVSTAERVFQEHLPSESTSQQASAKQTEQRHDPVPVTHARPVFTANANSPSIITPNLGEKRLRKDDLSSSASPEGNAEDAAYDSADNAQGNLWPG